MRKIFVAIISLLILFCVTGLGQAREHRVVKGECLSVIAKNYGQKLSAIVKANPEIKNPNLIFAGQTVVIPEGTAAKKSEEETLWVEPGLDPYGDKDPSLAINEFLIPADVKAKLIDLVNQKKFVEYQIRKGKKLKAGCGISISNYLCCCEFSAGNIFLLARLFYSGQSYQCIRDCTDSFFSSKDGRKVPGVPAFHLCRKVQFPEGTKRRTRQSQFFVKRWKDAFRSCHLLLQGRKGLRKQRLVLVQGL